MPESKKSESSLDLNRIEEEPWSHNNEKFIQDIRQDCLHRYNIHDSESHINKKKHILMSVPAIILPLITANLSFFLEDNANTVWVIPLLMTFTGIISGLNTLFEFSVKKEKHDQQSNKYAELAGEIQAILIRGKQYRQPYDVSVQSINCKKSNLDTTSPYV